MTFQQGPLRPRNDLEMTSFNAEVSYGGTWISLNDDVNFKLSSEGFGEKAYSRRRTTATSPYYDGTYLVHSTLENVQEGMEVYVLGTSQNHVTENILLLEEVFSQDSYLIRVDMDDHRETWSCQCADYTISRGHIQMHNVRASMKLSIPRLPSVTYEVNL